MSDASTAVIPDFTGLSAHLTDLPPHARSSRMLLLHEELARARMRSVQHEASELQLRRRLVAARRWQRKAEEASRRARLALAAL